MKRALAVTAVLASSAVVAGPAPASASASASAYDGVEQDCQNITTLEDPTHYETGRPSLPLQEMEVDQAVSRLRKLGRRPGAGVVVAVIDSGVATAAPIRVVGRVDAGNKQPEPLDHHGTAVAGLIAGHPRGGGGGAVGVAPFAGILDVQVYDDSQAAVDAPDRSPITAANVVQGLDAVIAAAPALGIHIVNMSLAVPDDPAIRDRVARLWDLGVVVVAPTGNRAEEPPAELPGSFSEGHQAGEDAAPWIHPADYDDVLGVNASAAGAADPDPTTYVMESSATDVAAPTAGAVSYSLRGESCLLTTPATSYAAAEVSGVLALLQSAYDEPIQASITRLLASANGRVDIPNTLVGAGEVRALDALTRPLQLDPTGANAGQGSVVLEPQVLSVPEEPGDVLASTRADTVWWGLLGGGTLLLALVLRPVLARRRTLSR